MYMRDDRMLLLAAGLFTLLVVWMSMFPASAAAFSGPTENAGDQRTAGEVAPTDDDGDGAMSAVTRRKPGDTADRLQPVTYSGSFDALW